MCRWRSLATLALLMVAPSVGRSEEIDSTRDRVHELAVELVNQAGVPQPLTRPEQIEVTAEGRNFRVLDVEPVGEWSVTLLFDTRLSTAQAIRDAATDLSQLADELVALGSVEIVVADEEFTRAMAATRNAEAVREALAWIGIRETGEAAQLEVRRRFIEDFRVKELAQTRYAAVSATAAQRLSELRFGVKQSLQAELRIVEDSRRKLLEWAFDNRRGATSLMLLVSPGDDDSMPFYETVLSASGLPEALDGITEATPEPIREDVGRALSSLGWVVVGFSPDAPGESLGVASRRSAEERVETVVQDGQVVDRTIFTPRFDPRDLLRKGGEDGGEGEPDTSPRLLAPLQTLSTWADSTGGEVAVDRRGLAEVLAGLANRFLVRVEEVSGSFAPVAVEVRYAAGYGRGLPSPRARRWVSNGTPEVMAEIRGRRLLDDGVEEGSLLVTAHVVGQEGVDRLVAEVEAGGEAFGEVVTVPLRLTLGRVTGTGAPEFVHTMLGSGAGVEELDDGDVEISIEMPFATDSGRPLVVLVEDLTRGRWGGAYATVLSGVAGDLQAALSTAPRAVSILEPEEQMVVGSTLFEIIHDEEVARVEFYLDGDLAGERRASPYALRLDMGSIPEPHVVEVIAFDAEGGELGRDRLTVNESGGVFRVRIVRPEQSQGREGELLLGPVTVEADVESPRTASLARVEFFWNEELVATRYAEPFVQRITVPEDRPQGFFRVVAHLDDGSAAEDVVFVNSPGGTERVRVELVQLYAVVTDRDGRPLQGLGADDFRVLEGGEEQEIETFSEANDQPLTVGLAVDTSASMFVKLPRVQRAASGFLGGLAEGKDSAFLVDFGTDPRLYHGTSKDLDGVESALYDLKPDGQTAIWKGISFSLVQLQGIQGKKALIVFSDGADEDPDFSYRTCLKFARRVGVPIYVVVSNDEIYRTGGRGLNVRGFINRLESLTRAVGGRVFYSRVGEDLGEIYAQIEEELRSQYVIGYYAKNDGENRWRSVRVEVEKPGARARTIAGYFR